MNTESKINTEEKSKGIATRSERRGRSAVIWNDTLKKFDHYRLSNRGKWIMVFPNSNRDIPNAQPLGKKQVNKMLIHNI